jgi:tetratricopeptide (TPR) repeat protein
VHDEIGGIVGGTRAREKLGAITVQYLEGLERDYSRHPDLAWELVNAYARLAQSRGGAASSIGDTRGGAQFATKALALGAVVESGTTDNERLDRLFRIYEALVPIFHEAGFSGQAREAIDRMVRLAPQLSPLRHAEALKSLARYLDTKGLAFEAAEAFGRALAIVRELDKRAEKPAGTEAQLISTLVGFGRAQGLAGDFAGSVASLEEAIRRSETSVASEPNASKSARQLYWSHIALGDTLGSPMRFNMNRPDEAAAQYRKARTIAEKLVSADPGNEAAVVDLARTYSREGVALAAFDPDRALALLEKSQSLAVQTSAQNHSGLDSRLHFLISSVEPLVRLGDFERARVQMAEARRLAAEMKQAGVKVDEASLLRAEAIRLHASGQAAEALAEARKQLALHPDTTSRLLSQNYQTVELLERMRTYAAAADSASCTPVDERLTRVWQDLRGVYPQSMFVAEQLERVHSFKRHGCMPVVLTALARRTRSN